MNKDQFRLLSWLGPVGYLLIWLTILPNLADVSTRLAMISLAIMTAAYCFLVASAKNRRSTPWGIVGLIAGFFEFGLIPVVVLSLVASKTSPTQIQGGTPQ